MKQTLYYPFIKRIIDFILSLLAIVILSPVMLVVAVLVRINLGAPILFKQARPGLHEKTIYVRKFRSMSNKKDEQGFLLPDDQRMTRFGSFLRTTSLDELPQLFSILKGDMSIVGPRPQSYDNCIFMNEKQRKRHDVLPGLTGLAQVNGRNMITWEEKINYDLQYAERITFWGDFKIVIATVACVLKRSGITDNNHVTTESMGEFLVRTGKISQSEYLKRIQDYREYGIDIFTELDN